MQYFFYGTRIDPQTLARVLRRRPRRIGRLPAVAAARRVVALTGTPYPTLIKDENGTVQGIVVNGLGARDAGRQSWPEACRVTRGVPHYKTTTAETIAPSR